jgi:hypothetical protein
MWTLDAGNVLQRVGGRETDEFGSIRTSCRGCRDLVIQNLQRLVTELSMVPR